MKYSPEIKAEALRLVEEESLSAVAVEQRLGVANCTVGRWLAAKKPSGVEKAWARNVCDLAKIRAGERGVPFDLDRNFVFALYQTTGGMCPVFKLPFVFNAGKTIAMTPSLDCRNPDLGYVRDNVAVISHKANRMKQDVSDPAIFRALLRYVEGAYA